MKRKNKTIILISTILISVALNIFLQVPLNSQTIPTKFTAGENMGFDLGPGNINFGKIVPGHSASRSITITNTYQHPTITKVESSGKISPYLVISENNFILQSTESKEITFSVYPEEGIELKEYPGKITITTSKV